MSLSAGNISCRIPFHFRNRVFFIPWVKKNNATAITSLQRRDGSSVPVRYIPKISSKTDKPETPLPVKGLEKNEFRDQSGGMHIPNISSKTDKPETPLPVKSSEKNEFHNRSGGMHIPKISSKTDKPETPLPVKDSKENEFRNRSGGMHIPNISSKTDKPETPLLVKGSKTNQFRNRSGGMRRSFILDKEKSQNLNQTLRKNVPSHYAEQDYELMEEPEDIAEEFCIHQEDDLKEDVSCDVKTKQEADKLAIELLAMRAFTAVEMRKKLQGKRFSPDIVEAVVDDFQSRGFINDGLYAETFSRSRWSSSSWGPRRIKQALLKKGVSEVAAENAIKLVFEGGESDAQASSSLGLSKLSMDHLFIQASKQWLRGQDVPRETRKSRIIRWLQYRGFNWEVISVILKKLESHHAP